MISSTRQLSNLLNIDLQRLLPVQRNYVEVYSYVYENLNNNSRCNLNISIVNKSDGNFYVCVISTNQSIIYQSSIEIQNFLASMSLRPERSDNTDNFLIGNQQLNRGITAETTNILAGILAAIAALALIVSLFVYYRRQKINNKTKEKLVLKQITGSSKNINLSTEKNRENTENVDVNQEIISNPMSIIRQVKRTELEPVPHKHTGFAVNPLLTPHPPKYPRKTIKVKVVDSSEISIPNSLTSHTQKPSTNSEEQKPSRSFVLRTVDPAQSAITQDQIKTMLERRLSVRGIDENKRNLLSPTRVATAPVTVDEYKSRISQEPVKVRDAISQFNKSTGIVHPFQRMNSNYGQTTQKPPIYVNPVTPKSADIAAAVTSSRNINSSSSRNLALPPIRFMPKLAVESITTNDLVNKVEK